MKTALKKLVLILIITIIAIGLYLAYLFLYPNYSTEKKESVYLYIYPTTTKQDIKNQLQEKLQVHNISGFDMVSKALRFRKIRVGRYEVKNGMNNLSLVRMLRNGTQKPMKLRIKPVRTNAELSNYLSKKMMQDSASFMQVLNDTVFLKNQNLTPQTVLSLFIPNSYEIFWNASAKSVFNRMKKEYDHFWNAQRKQKASKIPLTIMEVNTLASIVDWETNNKQEKPIVAGLYINRLKKGIPLQSDPTVIFAVGDFTIRRVLNKHLRFKSPYNTYLVKGLPPSPIRTPTVAGIDAVLNYDKNDFIFMCASEKFNGCHNFAKTLSEHMKNARKYQKALNERGIK